MNRGGISFGVGILLTLTAATVNGSEIDLCSNLPGHEPSVIDFSTWSVVQYGRWEQGPAKWVLRETNQVAVQTVNADASILLSDFILHDLQVQGVWRVDDDTDDDMMGFVFGYVDDQHFYLFDWKQADQFGGRRGFAQRGMSVKRIHADSPLTADDLWPTFPSNTNRMAVLYHNTIPWEPFTDYEFTLEFFTGLFIITVRQNTNVLARVQIEDNTYATGRFGLYNSSQEDVLYRAFTRRNLPPLPTLTITDTTLTEGTGGTTDALFSLTLSTPYCRTVYVDVATLNQSALAPIDYLPLNPTQLSFAPGEILKTVRVPVQGDNVMEPTESFLLQLLNPVRLRPARLQATAWIQDDDLSLNLPPLVEILSPADGASFPSPSTLFITAAASDPDGTVRRVDFFAGNSLLGSVTEAPFELSWTNRTIGTYTLQAWATDDQGAQSASPPVTIHFAQSSQYADVAIVRNFSHPEIQTLEDYIAEMNMTSQVFDQESTSFDLLSHYRLVIWDDLGLAETGLRSVDVHLLHDLFQAGIPLYLIGEKLLTAGAALPEPEQSLWLELIHLNPAPTTTAPGVITALFYPNHPVTDGPFGAVVSFPYPNPIEPAQASQTGEEALGQSGETDTLVAFQHPVSGTRSFTQTVLAVHSPEGCGVAERKRLFKNAVWWLVQNPPLPRFLNLFVTIDQSPAEPAAGELVTYTIVVTHNGELAATEVTLSDYLPPEMTFISAQASQGTCSNLCGILHCFLGELSQSAEATLTITAIPSTGGTYTNLATVSSSQGEARTSDNSATIITRTRTPPPIFLDLIPRPGQTPLLQLTAGADRRYLLEASTNLQNWDLIRDFIATQAVTQVEDTLSPPAPQRFYRAKAP